MLYRDGYLDWETEHPDELTLGDIFPDEDGAKFWLISNPVPWTQSDRDLMAKFSDQITLFSDSREQETTGQRDITQKALNSSTQYWTLYEKNLNHVTAYKASN